MNSWRGIAPLRSSTLRLSLLYLGLLLVSVAALFSFFYGSTTVFLDRQIDETIDTEVAGLRDRYLANGLPGLIALVSNRSRRNADERTFYLLADASYKRITGNVPSWPATIGPASTAGGGLHEFDLPAVGDADGSVRRVRARTFSIQKDFKLLISSGDFYLLVGRDVQELSDLRSQMLLAFAWGLAITVVVGAAGGLWIGRRFARRIEQINAASRLVMAGDLTVRVPETHRLDDLEELALHFNRMLAQIETLMAGVRQVSDNIAHDLRTPLARLRNELETAVAGIDEDAKDTRERLERAIAEADGLLHTFSALLRIARIEAGERRAGFCEVELSRIMSDVVELYEPLAEERNQRIEQSVSGAAWVSGDRDLLFQAVANLVDNAVKYSPEGGAILLAMDQRDGGHKVRVSVSDRGPGIAPADRTRVFDRFFRVEESRSAPGNGLGLSLVAAVAKLHNAEVSLEDAKPGLRIAIELDAVSRPGEP